MCGIAGWLRWGAPPDETIVRAMTASLAHRGPDAQGCLTSGPVSFGHRRLSIIDLSAANDQPMRSACGRLIITYNGELYNFASIRRELEEQGVAFRTAGDTEVILEAYRKWGPQCLQHFNGMFALAIWDDRDRTLFIARDRLGEKPLFYYDKNDAFIFASEPQALRKHPHIPREIDPISLGNFLTLNYTLQNRSLNAGVKQLPPAHYAILREGRSVQPVSYWDLAGRFRGKRGFSSFNAATEELTALIDDAVSMRLVSDVPLGAFLSGGVDSSAIVAAMVRARPPETVQSFSAGFLSKQFDETDDAAAVAGHLRTNHSNYVVGNDLPDILNSIVRAADEPLADTSVIPTWALSQFARSQVKVVLSGDGGDEGFAGYETYLADRLHTALSWLPSPAGRSLTFIANNIIPTSFGKVSLDDKLRRFTGGLGLSPDHAHFSWRTIFTPGELKQLMVPDWHRLSLTSGIEALSEFEYHAKEVADCHVLDRGCYVDIKTWLADNVLVKLDRMTMAHGLEARAPLLDHRIIEFAASLPVEWKLNMHRTKFILKASQKERLPDRIINRSKRGFNAPVSQWLNGTLLDYARDLITNPVMFEWFNKSYVLALLESHKRGTHDHGLKLFGLMCFSLWTSQNDAQ